MSTSSNDIDSSRATRSTSAKPEVPLSNGTEATQDDTNAAASVASSISSSRIGGDLSSVDGPAKSTEPRGRSINASPDSSEHFEGKKSRKTKKGKSAEKDSEAGQEPEKEAPPPKVELSEAPLPSVNFWVQRQQQQAAKAKIVDQSASPGAVPTRTSTDARARPSHTEVIEGNRVPYNGKPSSKRDGEPSRNGSNHGSKRSAPRGARAQEKESETNLLANNSASWPTPETAAVNLKAQPQAQQEKSEKEEKDDAGAAKPKQKKEWVQLPNFVPTVKFETALPGRGPRGGRIGGSRGGRDVAAASSTDRTQDTNPGARTNPGSKRATTEGSGPREGRKNISHTEHSKILKESTSGNAGGEQLKPIQSGVVNGTSHGLSGQDQLTSQRPEENAKSSESHKDMRAQNNRDTHHQVQNVSNHRSGERARGGGRGRGGFNQNNPNGVPHYTQTPYSTQHHAYPFQTSGSRHVPHYGPGYQPMSYPFPGQPGPGQRRTTSGNRRQANGRVPIMAPMNLPYDTNMYHPPGGGMYPYDAGNLLQLAQTQVEYYFSVENCVKDWYLRKHMDSLGFVPLTVIASFNRMRELLVESHVLRQACMDSVVLELVMGGDGVERVRSREGWEKWVIQDKSLRHPSARHDGPSSWQQFSTGFQYPIVSSHYPVEAHPVYSPTHEHGFASLGNGAHGMPPLNVPTMNGINGHARSHESHLSAAVPEFSPSTASTFDGIKSASQNGSEDTKMSANKELNGVASPHVQPSPMTNGTGVVHENNDTHTKPKPKH